MVTALKPAGPCTAQTCGGPAGPRWRPRVCWKRVCRDSMKLIDGRSPADVASSDVEAEGQAVVTDVEPPVKPAGALAVLRGSLVRTHP
ncbi:hypothetical protein [Streptomyces sp. NBC_00344]|uniref:hypothetical protein n=1 Tax=Streptomyces sp. NBC_00344 TaxID=2975720 RepID=UPI002E208EC2